MRKIHLKYIEGMTGRLSVEIVSKMQERGIKLTAVESCTGGLFSSTITNVPGASTIFPGGFITYSDEAKINLGVSAESIKRYTVYSSEVALEMARAGAQQFGFGEIFSVGITGEIYEKDQEVTSDHGGLVYIALSINNEFSVTNRIKLPAGTNRENKKKQIVWDTLSLIKKSLA